MRRRNIGEGIDNVPSASWLLFPLALIMAVCGPAAQGAAAASRPKFKEPFGGCATLMLVRHWDAESGVLIGWLPMHRAEIHLRSLESLGSHGFDPDEAVQIIWERPKRNPHTGELVLSLRPRTFSGEEWIPVKQSPNLVKISKHYFLVQSITFEEVP
jgi:hypothetical protein